MKLSVRNKPKFNKLHSLLSLYEEEQHQHCAKHILLRSTGRKKVIRYSFGITSLSESVNDGRIYILCAKTCTE